MKKANKSGTGAEKVEFIVFDFYERKGEFAGRLAELGIEYFTVNPRNIGELDERLRGISNESTGLYVPEFNSFRGSGAVLQYLTNLQKLRYVVVDSAEVANVVRAKLGVDLGCRGVEVFCARDFLEGYAENHI